MNVIQEVDYYKTLLAIQESDINEELSKFSSFYFSVLQVSNFAEENYDKTEALIDSQIRDKAKEDGEKITEATVLARVKMNPIYQQAFTERNASRALKEAYKSKGNMLIQLATNMREELKNLNHGVKMDNTSEYNQYL